MWSALFPNWNKFEVYLLEKEVDFLDRLFGGEFEFINFRKCPSHQIFLIKPLNSTEACLFLKVFFPRLFRRNRPKHYLQTLRILKTLEIPVIKPFLIFWKNPLKALIKGNTFYGGVLSPYIKEGFLKEDNFFKDSKRKTLNLNFLEDLVRFIYHVHQKGILVKDTKYNNFFYNKTEGFKLFDLDGVKFLGRPLKKPERLRDLSTLAMSLQWKDIASAELIFNLYKNLYSDLKEEDFKLFVFLVKMRKSKREKHLSKV